MSVNYPLGTITPKLGLSLYGQDEVLADNFIQLDNFASTGVVGALGISGGNTLGTTGTSAGTLYFQGGNNVTLSGNNSTIIINAAAGGGGGGGIAASLSGNTSGALALVSSGTLILAGGNNITLSQNGQSVTVSGPNTVAQSNQTAGVYASSQTVGQSSSSTYDARSLSLVGQGIVSVGWSNSSLLISATTAQSIQTQNLVDISLSGNTAGALALISSGTAIFAGGNNVTLSQNGQSVTISAFNQSVQTQNCVDLSLSGNTAGALALLSSGTAILAGGNNITLSQNGQSVTISGPNTVAQTNQSLGIYASSQTIGQSSSSTYDARSLSFVGQGIVSVGWSNSSLLISATTAAQTNQTIGVYASSQTVGQSSSSTIDARSFTYVGQGIVSVGMSAGSLLISATTPSQTNQTLGIYASSQTIGQSSSSTYDARSLSIVGSGIASVGWSNSSLIVSVPAGGGAGFTAGISGGNTSGNTGTTSNELVLAGGNNITLSGATGAGGMSVTVSAFNQSTQTQNCVDVTLAGNTTGTLALISSGTMTLAGGNNITLSQNGNAITIGDGFNTLSQWWAIDDTPLAGTLSSSVGAGFVHIWPAKIAGFYSATRANWFISMSLSTSSNSSFAAAISVALGIFTRNGSSLGTISSGQGTFQFSNTSQASVNSLSGMRMMSIPININLTPGNYWYGLSFTSSTTNANWMTLFEVLNRPSPATGGLSGSLGQAANVQSNQLIPGLGRLSVSTSNFSVIAFSDLQGSGTIQQCIPMVNFCNFTT